MTKPKVHPTSVRFTDDDLKLINQLKASMPRYTKTVLLGAALRLGATLLEVDVEALRMAEKSARERKAWLSGKRAAR